MVQKLVELHGGTVTADSEVPARGATLPCGSRHRSQESSTPTPPCSIMGEPGKTRILLIDDNTDLGRSMARLLQLLGHEVAMALDGAAGLQAAHTSGPN